MEPAQRLQASATSASRPGEHQGQNSPAQYGRHKAQILDSTVPQPSPITLDDAVDDIAEEAFVIPEQSCWVGFVGGGGRMPVVIEVQLVDAIRGTTGDLGRHFAVAWSLGAWPRI